MGGLRYFVAAVVAGLATVVFEVHRVSSVALLAPYKYETLFEDKVKDRRLLSEAPVDASRATVQFCDS